MNQQWRTPAVEHRSRQGFAAAALVTLVVSLGCGSNSTDTSTEGQLSPAAAYDIVVKETEQDPALTEAFPHDDFVALARIICEDLDEGGSPEALANSLTETPTQTGRQLRPESTEAIVSSGVRAYCPHHASKLQ